MTPSKVIWSRPGQLTIYAPISVVCLTLHTCMEQMLEKGGGLAVKMFSKGTLQVPIISLSHTVHDKEIRGIVRDM